MKTSSKRSGQGLFVVVALYAILGLGGCASTDVRYDWSHAMSGEYLFAYDRSSCEQSVGSAASPAFFSCMEDMGYFRIDPVTGSRVASASELASELASESASAEVFDEVSGAPNTVVTASAASGR